MGEKGTQKRSAESMTKEWRAAVKKKLREKSTWYLNEGKQGTKMWGLQGQTPCERQ